ncbi:MAG: DUF6089 family protein [Bacteroidia bacterium]
MKNVLIILICLFAKLSIAQKGKPANKSKTTPQSTANKAPQNDPNMFNNTKLSKWALALNYGGTYTMFDIDQDVLSPIFGGSLRYSFGHVASIRLQGLYGTYTGRNNSGFKNSLGFVNNITQVGVNMMFNIGSVNFRKKNPNTIFYFFTGFSANFNDAITDKKLIIGSDTARIKYSNANVSIPVGLGLKFKLSNSFDLGFEGVVNLIKSDRLDLYEDPNKYPDLFGSYMFVLGYNFTGTKRTQHIDWANPVTTIYDDLVRKSAKATDELKRDGDADGIPDYLDLELNTKAGYKVNVKGITLDSDVDGIPDTEDADPYGFNQMLSVYYPAETFKVKTSTDVMKFSDSIPEADFITLNSDGYGLPVITFAPNKYDIHVDQYPLLQQVARIMTVDTSVSIAVIGHADNNKPDLTQFTIAEKRALAVKRQLMKIYEIESERILIFSERDVFVRKYKMQTEGLDRKAEFRLIRKQE